MEYRILLTVVLFIIFGIVFVSSIFFPEETFRIVTNMNKAKKVTKSMILVYRVIAFLWIIFGALFLYLVWSNAFEGI